MNICCSFRTNTGLKVLSVITAVFIWIFVTLQKESDLTLKAPVEIINLPAGLTVADTRLPEVVITIKGARFDAMLLRRERLKVLLDLKGVREGMVTFPAMENQVRLPVGLKLIRVFPSKLVLNLERSRAD